MPAVVSASGRLHTEFVRLLFLQAHRETDRFLAASGVQCVEQDRGLSTSVTRFSNFRTDDLSPDLPSVCLFSSE